MSWKTDLLDDKRYAKFKQQWLKTWSNTINVLAVKDEILLLHTSRKNKKLRMMGDKLVDTIIDVTVQDQANRSRLCHIKLEINDVSSTLVEYRDSLTDYLMTTYVEGLNEAGLRSKESKVAAIQTLNAFAACNKFLAELDVLWANCDLVINDIDQAGFSTKRVLDALNIHTARQHSI